MLSSTNALVIKALNESNEIDEKIVLLNKIYEFNKRTHELTQLYFMLSKNQNDDAEWSSTLDVSVAQVTKLSFELQTLMHDDDPDEDLDLLYVRNRALSVRVFRCIYEHHVDDRGNKVKLEDCIRYATQVLDYFDEYLQGSDLIDIALLEDLYFSYEIINKYASEKIASYRSIIFTAAENYLDKHRYAVDIVLIQMILPQLLKISYEEFYESRDTQDKFINLCLSIIKQGEPLHSVIANDAIMAHRTLVRSASIRRWIVGPNPNVAAIVNGCTQLEFNQYLAFEKEQITELLKPSIALLDKMYIHLKQFMKSSRSFALYATALKNVETYLFYYLYAVKTKLTMHNVMPDKDITMIAVAMKFIHESVKKIDQLISDFKALSPWVNDSFQSSRPLLKTMDFILDTIDEKQVDNSWRALQSEINARSLIEEEILEEKSRKKQPRARQSLKNNHSTKSIKSIKSSDSEEELLKEAININNVYENEFKPLVLIEDKARLVHSTMMLELNVIRSLSRQLHVSGEPFKTKVRQKIRERIKRFVDTEQQFDALSDDYDKISASLLDMMEDQHLKTMEFVKADFADMKKNSDKLMVEIAILRESYISMSEKIAHEKKIERVVEYIKTHPKLGLSLAALSEEEINRYSKLQLKERDKNNKGNNEPNNYAESLKLLRGDFLLFQQRKDECEKVLVSDMSVSSSMSNGK